MSPRLTYVLASTQQRYFTTSARKHSPSNLASRWLSDLRARIGKCIIFGLKPSQVDEAGQILRIVTREWRELLAGSEGFLVGRGRAGLERHQVAWGEMVYFPCDQPGHVCFFAY